MVFVWISQVLPPLGDRVPNITVTGQFCGQPLFTVTVTFNGPFSSSTVTVRAVEEVAIGYF